MNVSSGMQRADAVLAVSGTANPGGCIVVGEADAATHSECEHKWTGWLRSGTVAIRRCRKCLKWERRNV